MLEKASLLMDVLILVLLCFMIKDSHVPDGDSENTHDENIVHRETHVLAVIQGRDLHVARLPG